MALILSSIFSSLLSPPKLGDDRKSLSVSLKNVTC